MPPPPSERDQQIIDAHGRGLGRNAIAKDTGVAPATVTDVCARHGLTFDRSATQAALVARKTDSRAKRAALEDLYLAEAKRLLLEMRKPHLVYSFGGRDNTYEEHELPAPDAHAKLKLMQASGLAVDRAIRLAEADSDSGVDAGRSMLGALEAGLKAVYAHRPPQADTEAPAA